jgi:hypothetical protein
VGQEKKCLEAILKKELITDFRLAEEYHKQHGFRTGAIIAHFDTVPQKLRGKKEIYRNIKIWWPKKFRPTTQTESRNPTATQKPRQEKQKQSTPYRDAVMKRKEPKDTPCRYGTRCNKGEKCRYQHTWKEKGETERESQEDTAENEADDRDTEVTISTQEAIEMAESVLQEIQEKTVGNKHKEIETKRDTQEKSKNQDTEPRKILQRKAKDSNEKEGRAANRPKSTRR